MDRKIKFRGKASHNGEWRHGFLVITEGESYHIIETCRPPLEDDDLIEDGHHVTQESDRPTWVDPDTVGQFTGLHDKNGKEIYEGDIILTNYEMNAEVYWDEGSASFSTHDEDGSNPLWDSFARECEVVGNIHDNSKLLEQTI